MEENKRFTAENYFSTEGEVKDYLTRFICQADYTDELSFYKSIDLITNQFYVELLDRYDVEGLKESREAILKMGMEEAKKVLLIISKK